MARPTFAPLPAADHVRKALLELQQVYLQTLDQTEGDVGRILNQSAARQIDEVIRSLDAFEKRDNLIWATNKNLQLLDDLMGAIAQLSPQTRTAAQDAWAQGALKLRQSLTQAAPQLGLELAKTDFARVSLQSLQVASRNSFGELSDFSSLQVQSLVNLKRDLADSMGRGLDYRALGKNVEKTGIEALAAIPGVRRAFSLEERGRMIGRTETVRIQSQLQDALGEEAGLDYGRSFLNWFLTDHHELCLWAEAMGWAPVQDFLAGPGLPPRHPNCGCSWQRGLKDWVDPESGPAALALQFADQVVKDGVKMSPDLLGRIGPHVTEALLKHGPIEQFRSQSKGVLM